MTRHIKYAAGATFAVALAAIGVSQSQLQESAEAASSMIMAPAFEVDPFWPKPLPNQWILGRTIGVDIDARDHVFIVHRDQDEMFGGATEIGLKLGVSECCTPAPPIIEFDPEGNVVNAWGGPGEGFTWPASNHGIDVAPNGNVWIGGNGGGDSHVLVFTGDGQFVAQYGEPGNDTDSNSTTHFAQVAELAIDAEANEVFLADGYRNKRVAVLDLNTGAFNDTGVLMATDQLMSEWTTPLALHCHSNSAAPCTAQFLPMMAFFTFVTAAPTVFRSSVRTVRS